MTCKHLKELYDICKTHQLKLSSTDLIRIVCPQCGVEEVCPSLLEEEYEVRHHEDQETDKTAQSASKPETKEEGKGQS